VESSDVNEYLREVTGADFTAKDFRTWAGTVLAANALARLGGYQSETQARQNLVEAIRSVAERLGNTRAVCRKCYVHPAVIDGYLAGRVIQPCREPGEACERAVLALVESEAKAA
jgi:DNA topoisomerase-1